MSEHGHDEHAPEDAIRSAMINAVLFRSMDRPSTFVGQAFSGLTSTELADVGSMLTELGDMAFRMAAGKPAVPVDPSPLVKLDSQVFVEAGRAAARVGMVGGFSTTIRAAIRHEEEAMRNRAVEQAGMTDVFDLAEDDGSDVGFPAQYLGTCGACDNAIEPGDMIISTRDGYAHVEC